MTSQVCIEVTRYKQHQQARAHDAQKASDDKIQESDSEDSNGPNSIKKEARKTGMACKYSVSGKGGIRLVKKNDSWLPQREKRKTTLEVHGYTVVKDLGEGAFAKVKLAKSKKHNCNVAIKIIDKRKAPKDYICKFLPREIHIMHRLNHPNIVKLYEAIETDTRVYLVLELAEGGDLLEFINSKKVVPENETRALFCQLAATLAYCHKESVVHRDLKCENLLLDEKGRLKITDFGFATNTLKSPILETFCGSYAYCCPEILRGQKYHGPASDVWSMGVILYALVSSRLPFSDDDLRALMKNEPRKLKFSRTTSPACRQLIRKMLTLDQNKRPTAEQLLWDPWCKEELLDNPDLSYLGHRECPLPEVHPPPPPPSPISEYAEEVFPEVQPVRAKIGTSKIVTCLTSPLVSLPVTIKFDKGRRRHTITVHAHKRSQRRVSLRDEFLRTMAAKEMRSKSSQMLAEEMKRCKSLENVKKMNANVHVRRNSLVHDVLHVDHEVASERRLSCVNRKPSIVSDVTFHPRDARTSPQKLLGKKQSRKAILHEHAVGGRAAREQELTTLKFSKAGAAARMAVQEAHKEHERNKRPSLARLTTLFEDKMEKLEKWRDKCKRLLNKKMVFGDRKFSFKLVSDQEEPTESNGFSEKPKV